MATYRATADRPYCQWTFDAASDAEAKTVMARHPRGGLADLHRLVPGQEYPESEDGMRRGGRLPDQWVYVP